MAGYDNGSFDPHDPITREQLATILYRYAQCGGADVSMGEDTNILSYLDALEVSEYAIPTMQWACGAGIIQGTGDGSTVSVLQPAVSVNEELPPATGAVWAVTGHASEISS